MLGRWIQRSVCHVGDVEHTTIQLANYAADIEDVGQQLIEDNIVSLSRQMIDKEASVPKARPEGVHTNGAANGNGNGNMEIDEEL